MSAAATTFPLGHFGIFGNQRPANKAHRYIRRPHRSGSSVAVHDRMMVSRQNRPNHDVRLVIKNPYLTSKYKRIEVSHTALQNDEFRRILLPRIRISQLFFFFLLHFSSYKNTHVPDIYTKQQQQLTLEGRR